MSELEQKRHQAAIMFIKECMPVKAICERLKISTAAFTQWSKAGKWVELRPSVPRQKINPLRRDAQILYVKNGLSLSDISQQLNLSMPTLKKWKDAELWYELRPDFELLNQHKAAGMYIEKGISTSEISEKLNISQVTLKMWVYLYGWDAARLISSAADVTTDIVSAFCTHFKNMFPDDSAKIQAAENDYIKNIKPKI